MAQAITRHDSLRSDAGDSVAADAANHSKITQRLLHVQEGAASLSIGANQNQHAALFRMPELNRSVSRRISFTAPHPKASEEETNKAFVQETTSWKREQVSSRPGQLSPCVEDEMEEQAQQQVQDCDENATQSLPWVKRTELFSSSNTRSSHEPTKSSFPTHASRGGFQAPKCPAENRGALAHVENSDPLAVQVERQGHGNHEVHASLENLDPLEKGERRMLSLQRHSNSTRLSLPSEKLHSNVANQEKQKAVAHDQRSRTFLDAMRPHQKAPSENFASTSTHNANIMHPMNPHLPRMPYGKKSAKNSLLSCNEEDETTPKRGVRDGFGNKSLAWSSDKSSSTSNSLIPTPSDASDSPQIDHEAHFNAFESPTSSPESHSPHHSPHSSPKAKPACLLQTDDSGDEAKDPALSSPKKGTTTDVRKQIGGTNDSKDTLFDYQQRRREELQLLERGDQDAADYQDYMEGLLDVAFSGSSKEKLNEQDAKGARKDDDLMQAVAGHAKIKTCDAKENAHETVEDSQRKLAPKEPLREQCGVIASKNSALLPVADNQGGFVSAKEDKRSPPGRDIESSTQQPVCCRIDERKRKHVENTSVTTNEKHSKKATAQSEKHGQPLSEDEVKPKENSFSQKPPALHTSNTMTLEHCIDAFCDDVQMSIGLLRMNMKLALGISPSTQPPGSDQLPACLAPRFDSKNPTHFVSESHNHPLAPSVPNHLAQSYGVPNAFPLPYQSYGYPHQAYSGCYGHAAFMGASAPPHGGIYFPNVPVPYPHVTGPWAQTSSSWSQDATLSQQALADNAHVTGRGQRHAVNEKEEAHNGRTDHEDMQRDWSQTEDLHSECDHQPLKASRSSMTSSRNLQGKMLKKASLKVFLGQMLLLCAMGLVSVQAGPDLPQDEGFCGFYGYDTACPAGCYATFHNEHSNGIDCQFTPPGYYSLESETRLLPCEVGTFSDVFSTGCEKCPVGSYAREPASTECQLCPSGYFANQTGQKECLKCSTLYYDDLGSNAVVIDEYGDMYCDLVTEEPSATPSVAPSVQIYPSFVPSMIPTSLPVTSKPSISTAKGTLPPVADGTVSNVSVPSPPTTQEADALPAVGSTKKESIIISASCAAFLFVVAGVTVVSMKRPEKKNDTEPPIESVDFSHGHPNDHDEIDPADRANFSNIGDYYNNSGPHAPDLEHGHDVDEVPLPPMRARAMPFQSPPLQYNNDNNFVPEPPRGPAMITPYLDDMEHPYDEEKVPDRSFESIANGYPVRPRDLDDVKESLASAMLYESMEEGENPVANDSTPAAVWEEFHGSPIQPHSFDGITEVWEHPMLDDSIDTAETDPVANVGAAAVGGWEEAPGNSICTFEVEDSDDGSYNSYLGFSPLSGTSHPY